MTESYNFIIRSLNIIQKRRKLIYPFLSIIILINYFLYLAFTYNFSDINKVIFVISAIFIILFLFTFANALLILMIYQIEIGKSISISSALRDLIGFKFLFCLPVSFLYIYKWTLQGFLIGLTYTYKMLFNKIYYNDITKFARIEISMILPSILWKNKNYFEAKQFSKFFQHSDIHKHSKGFYLTEFLDLILIIPIYLIIFIINKENSLHFLLIFGLFNVSLFLSILFIITEQIYFIEHYLWYLKWEWERYRALNERRSALNFNEISRPSVLDNIPDLLKSK